jgi:hypothetical protein
MEVAYIGICANHETHAQTVYKSDPLKVSNLRIISCNLANKIEFRDNSKQK